MRVVRLVLIGVLAYVVSVVVLFPAAPVVERVKARLPEFVELGAVRGTEHCHNENATAHSFCHLHRLSSPGSPAGCRPLSNPVM